MNGYVRKGNYFEITLDDGRIVKADGKYIDTMVSTLDLTEYDALMTFLEDEEYLIDEEQNELCEKAKENKVTKIGAKAKETVEKKTQRERVVKANPEKENIIAELAKVAETLGTNVVIENKGKIITFKVGDNE